MKIKKNILLCIFILVVFLITGIALLIFRTKNIENFFHYDANKITKIYITDGNTGNIKELTLTDDINKINSYLSDIKLRKIINSESSGWSYSISSYNEKDEEELNITFISDDFCKIKGNKYKIEKGSDVSIVTICKKYFK